MLKMMNLEKEITNYLTYCSKQKQLSIHTIRAYKNDLAQFLDYERGQGLCKQVITQYIYYLHEKFAPKTVRRKIASLKAFVHYLYYQDIIEVNPFDKINSSFKEPKVLPRTIPEYLVKSILQATYTNMLTAKSAFANKMSLRNTAVLELLFATGARISEICSLKTENIDLTAHTIKILGKGAKERILQIENNDVLKILQQYNNEFASFINRKGYFFINNRYGRLSEQSVRNIIKKLEKQINSDIHITPHMFRHTMATMLLEEDVDIRYIQRILGHSSITTTQIYTHVTSSKQKEILQTKHPRNKFHFESNANI